MYNPFTRFPITGTWAQHRARGSLGGIDRGMPKGTALPATEAGVVSFLANNGTLGHTVTIRHDNGTKTQYGHCSQFVGANGRRVVQGEVVAKSGGVPGEPGAGTSTGAHLHSHSINQSGVRVYPFHENPGVPSGTTPTPIEQKEEQEMNNAGFYYTAANGNIVQLICNTTSGWFHEYGQGTKGAAMPGGYNNAVAAAFRTGSFASITESHAKEIKKTLLEIQKINAAGASGEALARLEAAVQKLQTTMDKVAQAFQ